MFRNPDPEAICALLREVKTIAVVGLSPNPDRPAFHETALHQDARPRQRLRRASTPSARPSTSPRRRSRRSPTAISASAATSCWWSSPPRGRTPISATASSTPMAARSSSAATARAASCASCTTRASPASRDPRRDALRPHRAAPRGRRPGDGGHGRAALSPAHVPFVSPRATRWCSRCAWATRRWRSPRCRWAIRTRCRWWPTSTPRRCRTGSADREPSALPGSG
jgi:hypothetical protein